MKLAPAVALTLWGGAYLWRCADAALPKGGLDIALPTKKGPARLVAKRLSYDIVRRSVVAYGVALYSPTGEAIARAGWVNLRAPLSEDPSFRIRAGGVEAQLERTADGRWKHFDLLPESRPEQQETPVDLTIESATVGILDRTADRPSELKVLGKDLHISGSGKRWLVAGAAQVNGCGSVKGLVRVAPEVGFGFNVVASGLDAGALFNAVKGNLETRKVAGLKSYDVASAIVNGALRGHVSPRGALAFEAHGKLEATGLNLAGRNLARLSIVGSANESAVSGAVRGEIQGIQAEFKGKAAWANGFQAFGAVAVEAKGTGRIPKWAGEYLPRELHLGRSQFAGWFSLDKNGQATIDGTVRADEAKWSGESVMNAVARLHVDPHQVLLADLKGLWMNSLLSGDIGISLDRSELAGLLNAKHLDLGLAGKRVGGPNLSGWANLTAALSGKLARPVIDIRSNATAGASIYGSPRVALGNIEFAGRYLGGKLNILRFAAAGRNGVFVARGSIDVDASRMDLSLDGNGVRLAEFSPDLKGTGLFRLDVKGTPSQPVAMGRAEIIGAEVMGYEIPFAGGTIRWDANGVMVRDLIAVKGATTAKGYASWNSRDRQLDGEVAITDVILSDWLGDTVTGSLGIRRATLRGTIENPVISARGSGRNIVVSGVRVDSVSFNIHALKNLLFVSELKLEAGQGSASASGYLDLQGSIGVLTGEAKGLPLARLYPGNRDSFALDGTVEGQFIANFDGQTLSTLSSSGTVQNVAVNGALIGSGEWKLQGLGSLWSASAMVGQIERYVELDVPYYDQNEQTLRGTITAYNIGVGTIHDALKRYLPKDSPRMAQRLELLQGDVGLSAEVSLDEGEASLNIANATIERLSLDQQDLGRLSLNATRKGRLWSIKDLTWQKDGQKASISGTIDEDGELEVDGDIYNLRNQLLCSLFPDLPNLTGSVDLLSFSANGPTRSPTIHASLQASNVGLANDSVKAEDLITTDVNISNLLISEGSIKAEGWVFYKGIRGEIQADLPFHYPLEIPEGEPIRGSLTLATNQLEAFVKYVPNLSPATKGLVTGTLALSGTVGNPVLNGEVKVDAPIVAVNGVDTYFKDVKAGVSLLSNEATVYASAAADKGGTIEASTSAKNIDLTSLLTAPSKLLSLPISGYININNANLHHNGNKYGSISLVADGKVGISGSVRSPVFRSTGIALKEVSGIAPSEFTQQPENARPEIDPQFDVRFNVLPLAKAKASNAEVFMYGYGNLTGSMFRPNMQANLTLSKGSLKLPNARIQLHEGGSMRFAYSINQDGLGQARMDVDLHGSTNVAAVRYGDTVDRYAIDLQMRGDILEAGKLQITAQSDPPDLSQDRILNILGQGDFFQGLAQGNQSAIASFALPTFLDPVTSLLAKNFGLEYLMVEYDLQKRTTLTAARTLGNGFTLMGRRQISPATFGRELYEIKLNYRLPFNNATLRSFMLSLGADQDRPWKFTVEYGKRF